jgi:hypothetical protein
MSMCRIGNPVVEFLHTEQYAAYSVCYNEVKVIIGNRVVTTHRATENEAQMEFRLTERVVN